MCSARSVSSVEPMTPRITAVDVARGLAILGTLGTNIWIFSHVGGLVGYLNDPWYDTDGTGARLVQSVAAALMNGKFLGLLMIMFGIGLAIQHAGASRRGLTGRSWLRAYFPRAAVLLLDGVVNFVLVIEFDVLMGYAVTGAVVAWLLTTSPRVRRALTVAAAALHVLVISALTAAAILFSRDAAVPAGAVVPDPNPYADGSFWDLVLFRLDNAVLFRVEPVLTFLLGIVLFQAGIAVWRQGLFEDRGARLRRRLMIAGGALLPIDLALNVIGGPAGMIGPRYLLAPVVALGLLAAVAEWAPRNHTRPGQWIHDRLAEAGRASLSCYLLQNVIASALFYGWGAGLAERLEEHRVTVTLAALAVIVALEVAFGHLWLRRFDRGPLEQLSAWAVEAATRRVPRSGARPVGCPDSASL